MFETMGQDIAKVAGDVLLRPILPMSGIRGQTYDGAPDMAGKNTGAQAIQRRWQPLALYIHCGAHCINLITQAGSYVQKKKKNTFGHYTRPGGLCSILL